MCVKPAAAKQGVHEEHSTANWELFQGSKDPNNGVLGPKYH